MRKRLFIFMRLFVFLIRLRKQWWYLRLNFLFCILPYNHLNFLVKFVWLLSPSRCFRVKTFLHERRGKWFSSSSLLMFLLSLLIFRTNKNNNIMTIRNKQMKQEYLSILYCRYVVVFESRIKVCKMGAIRLITAKCRKYQNTNFNNFFHIENFSDFFLNFEERCFK